MATHHVSIEPQWSIRTPEGEGLPPRLIALLADVHEHGSLLAACKRLGLSYRHAWQMVRQGESFFGAPLLEMTRGQGSTLTPLADKLVWAHRRIAARLSPLLESLASELETEIERTLRARVASLRIHASHGFAIAALHETLTGAGQPVELKYCSSAEAVAALHEGGCELAGFHVPMGELEQDMLAHHERWLRPATQWLIPIATRHQGLMVAPGNPHKIYGLADLARPGVRFINRQVGSGTRFLVDRLLARAGVSPGSIAGYEQGEFTHAAVAAFVASGMADAAIGVETPARRFRLEFLPLQTERYFLLCDEATLATPGVAEVVRLATSAAFRSRVDEIAGYHAADLTAPVRLADMYPTLRR